MKEKKLICGVGVNDADYPVSKNEVIDGKWTQIWKCPYYTDWNSMLRRCYSEKYQKHKPSYVDCLVVPEWHYFMTFRAWMEKQDWEGKVLDKDLLIPLSKAYGPDSCLFITNRVNAFITERSAARGSLPIGVCFNKRLGKFQAQCSNGDAKSNLHLGFFKTPEEAHQKWLTEKLRQANILASEQKDPRVAAALIDRYENYGKYFGDK